MALNTYRTTHAHKPYTQHTQLLQAYIQTGEYILNITLPNRISKKSHAQSIQPCNRVGICP